MTRAHLKVTAPASAALLRRCSCDVSGGGCDSCRKKREGLHRSARGLGVGGVAPPIVHQVLADSGQPLDPGTRGFMESRFQHDFSAVRVHTDARAARSAAAVDAYAYTVGRHVVFDAGQYSPATSDGRQLLAHELAHVVQAGPRSDVAGPLRLGAADEASEGEARAQAGAIVAASAAAPLSLTADAHQSLRRSCRRNASESFYKTAPNYCKDSWFSGMLHPGRTCYREVPVRVPGAGCPPGDQVCFTKDGKCEDSFDRASPVSGKDSNGVCEIDYGCLLTAHLAFDVVPGLFGGESAGDRLACEARCARSPAGPLCIDSCMAAARDQ